MSETVTREQYNAKSAELKRAEDKKNNCKTLISSLDDRLQAVNKAISELEHLEDDFATEQRQVSKCLCSTGEFRGENYNKLISGLGKDTILRMSESKRMINQAADMLIDIRTKLQKEKNKQWGIFSGLADTVSSIKGWLRKHANDF